MPRISANDLELHYELAGSGEPLVLVHGGWSTHQNWQPVLPGLATSHRVVAYDRRGHGHSPRCEQGTRRDQEDDLAALIEALDLAPAHLVGTSFGASIAIGLAARRPQLVRSVIAHEPPLMSLVADDPAARPLLAEVRATIEAVLARLAQGDTKGGARQFVEQVALGPGAWRQLPEPLRATMVESAASFAAEQQDPDWASVDPAALARVQCPVLLTQGDQSPLWFRQIVARLAQRIDGAQIHTYRGAGHAPHLTNPDDYLATAKAFLAGARERSPSVDNGFFRAVPARP
jgi:pimeloyl-ACP methyl ester carboxylesterase